MSTKRKSVCIQIHLPGHLSDTAIIIEHMCYVKRWAIACCARTLGCPHVVSSQLFGCAREKNYPRSHIKKPGGGCHSSPPRSLARSRICERRRRASQSDHASINHSHPAFSLCSPAGNLYAPVRPSLQGLPASPHHAALEPHLLGTMRADCGFKKTAEYSPWSPICTPQINIKASNVHGALEPSEVISLSDSSLMPTSCNPSYVLKWTT